jgi:hypothetical protein
MDIDCNFCENNILFSDRYGFNTTKELINKWNTKQCNKSLVKLKLLSRMDDKICDYICSRHPEINNIIHTKFIISLMNTDKQSIITSYLHKRFKSDYTIKCNICNYNACSYHVKTGTFNFFKCQECDINVSICGWCNEYNIEKKTCTNILCNKIYNFDFDVFSDTQSASDDNIFIELNELTETNETNESTELNKSGKFNKSIHNRFIEIID